SPLLFRHGQADEIGDPADGVRRRQVADPPVQVQTELLGEDIVRGAEAIAIAALLEQSQVEFVGLPPEYLPRQLDIAVARVLDRSRWGRLTQGETECPPT